MPNTSNTPASVASRLTDEQIESIAESLEHYAENLYGDNTRSFMDDENNAAAVLRDYVRLRNLNGELRKCLKDAADWACGNPDEECCDCMCHGGDTPCKSESWFSVLAEGEKGEV